MKTLRAGEKLTQHPIITVQKCHQAAASELEADRAAITQGRGLSGRRRPQTTGRQEGGTGELENKCKKNSSVSETKLQEIQAKRGTTLEDAVENKKSEEDNVEIKIMREVTIGKTGRQRKLHKGNV